jgi:hypothetical protein
MVYNINKIISNKDNRINIIIKFRMMKMMMTLEMLMNKIFMQLIIESNFLTK